MKSAILVCLFAILAACTAQAPEGLKAGAPADSPLAAPPSLVQTLDDPTPRPPGNEPPRVVEAGQEAAACAARGGAYQPVCLLGRPMCVMPSTDAGRSCTDSSQCESACIAPDGAVADQRVTGVCARDNNPCGCRSLVRDGVATAMLCVD